MKKLKLFLIKIGLIPAPKGYVYNPIDKDSDGLVQEGTPFKRSVNVKIIPPKKKPTKKAPAKKKATKKATKKAK